MRDADAGLEDGAIGEGETSPDVVRVEAQVVRGLDLGAGTGW